LRVSLTAESPIELDAKELVMSKAERTAVVTFDVGARWSEAQRVSSRSADVKAAAIDGEYAGTSCKPVTLTLQPKPPSIAVSAGGDGTRSFKPAAALFGEVLLSDEDALIESAEVVLSFTVQAGASLSEVYSELGRRVVLSVPDSEPGIVHSMAVDRRGLKPEVRLALVGRSSAASYQRVLSSILVSDELEMVGVMSVDVRVIVEDADGAVTQTNVSMPSQARQVDVYPQSVVRIRLVEYPRDGTNDPGRIAAVQNEYVFSRAQAGVEKILVQALVDQDVAVSTMKSHRKSAAIKYVDVSVVAHGAAPDWSMASRAVMARPAESADCDSARFLNDRGWCPGATLSLLREDEQGEITPNVQIDRDVYVRLELADGSFQVIGPRTVSATWWDNAPLYELSIATRPASFGVTHVYCQDIIDSGDASSLTTICENTPFDEYWTTGLNAAPVSLHARLIPFAKFPVLGLSADMALTVLGNSQQVLGYDEVLAADVAEQSSEGDGLTGQFQASVGVDLRLPINERPVDVMFYVGSYQRDIGGASRLRMTMGVALIAPILIADQNDVHNALSEP
ncbi:hypothetical protein L6R46_25925, partial [Myxococcota bacterium]|nr:hypothetical protein [Myxococcota bacterium]